MSRFLVIDDDAIFCEMIKAVLESAGHSVEAATNGRLAISSYRKQPHDLVITDLIMPEIEGIEIIMELKRDYPDVKIIAISGGGRFADGPRCLKMAAELGASDILAKPFTPKQLLDSVSGLTTDAAAEPFAQPK